MLEFHPELFEAKARAQAALEEVGLRWVAHYTSVDPLHEEYGLEVEGLNDEKTARQALAVLRKVFPGWRLGAVWYRAHADARWCASLCKNQRACG